MELYHLANSAALKQQFLGVALPDLSNEYVVSAERVDSFRRDGFVLLRGVASHDEVAAYRPVILAARDRFGPAPTPLEERNTYGKAFLKGINLWERDEATRRFVLARRFAKVAADLLEVDGVRIDHDQSLLKPPYCSGGA